MATEGGIPAPISEKEEQNETGDLRCAQVLNPPEYTNKPLEDLKEHSYELEIDGGKTDSVASQSSEMTGQYATYKPATATNESSISSEMVKDQSLHSVTTETADTSEGEVFVEAPSRAQIQLEDICNRFNAGLDGENPINEEKDESDSGNLMQKDQKVDLEEEKNATIPKNLSSEANFTDTSLYTASATHVPLEMDDHPIKNSNSISDEHIFETFGANQSTERAAALSEERISAEIPENSVANQYQDLENFGDQVDDKQLEKSIDVMHGMKYSEPIKDREKLETQELTENLSVNPERLSVPEELGETGLQKDDEENDSANNSSGHPSEEQSLKDDGRVYMEKYHEEEEITGVVSSNETTQRQDITSVEGKEEKLEESSYLASEEKILKTLDATKKESEIKDGKASADASVKESSNVQLSAEKSVQEDEMLSDKVGNVSSKEPEKIQETSVTIMETETWKEKDTEMDPHTGTLQIEKEPEESKFIEDSKADKDVEYINLVATEKSPETKYESKDNTENEELDVKEQQEDGQKDVSISTKMEFPGSQNDQVNSLQATDAIDTEDTLGGENLNDQAKAKPEQEKFEEACRIVEALDARETVAIAISMDEPHVVPATEISVEETIQDKETAHSRNEKKNEVQEEEETHYGNLDASAPLQLTDETQSLNEVKETQKLAEISEVMQDNDHCHEKVLNQNDLDNLIAKYGTTGVSKSHNEEGIQEHDDEDGIGNDKIERPLEEKHVEAIAEMKQSKWTKSSEEEHEQEAVSAHTNEHVDETINKETLGPAQIKDETDSVNLENHFIMVSKEVEVTEEIGKSEKEDIDSKSLTDMEEIPKEDEVMCKKTELMHEYQIIMTKGLNETGIAIEKNENPGENVVDLHVAHKLAEETIQVCENIGDIKQELEPENIEKASELASGDKSHIMVEDTEATDLDSSRDNVSMDTTLGVLSTTQAFFMGNSQNATDPVLEKINENIDHDKHIGGSLEMVAQKDIHKKIEDNRSMEDIIFGDEQIDEAKAGVCSNENQVEGEKEDPSHKPDGKEEKISNIINQGGDTEPARVMDEAPNNSAGDISDTHELAAQCIDDLVGSKHEEVSNSICEDQILETADNKEIDDRKEVHQKLEVISESVSEDKSQKTTSETEATKIENLNTDQNHNNMISEMINKNGDTEIDKQMDEESWGNNIKDPPKCHALAARRIHDAGEKHETDTSNVPEKQIHQTHSNKDSIGTDISKERTDSDRFDVISESVPEDQSGESEGPKVDNATDDNIQDPQIAGIIDDTQNAKMKNNEGIHKNTDDMADAVIRKNEEATNSSCDKQIHQTTNTEDTIKFISCKEKTDSEKPEIITVSAVKDQYEERIGESEATKSCNLTNDDSLNNIDSEKTHSGKFEIDSVSVVEDQCQETIGISEAIESHRLPYDDNLKNMSPDIGDLDDGHETAKIKDESILEDNMGIISGGHASVMEKLPGKVNEKHKATNFASEEQTCQATDTKENIQVALYDENIAIKKLEVSAESVPRDENEDTITSKIEKTLDDDMLNDMISPMSKSQALVEDYLQKDEDPTLYAESTEVHESTDHSISEEDKSSERKTSGSILQQSSESNMKEEPNNDAASGSNLKHNVVENACELEYKEEQDEEVLNKKETSDTIFEESPSMVSDTLVSSAEILSGELTTGENEATEDEGSLNTGCHSVEEGFQEGKEETNFVDAAPETVYSDKSNETDELNNGIKNGITNKEVETSDFTTEAENFEEAGNKETAKTETPEDDERQKMKVGAYDDQSHDTSSTCKGYTKIKLQNEQNENAEIEDEESTNNRVNDSPVTSALDGEAASGSMHGGQGESITWEEETEENKSLDQEKYKSVAQEESEVVNPKDEECVSKIDDNLSIMPVPAEEIGQEIDEKNEKNPDCEEQIHGSITTNNDMDHDMLEDDKNIEGIERASVGVSNEQSHESTARTGIIENDIVDSALSAPQNFGEEKTNKIAISSEGNDDGHEAKQVSKIATDTLLKEAQATEGTASGTSMQSQGIESDELSQVPTSVSNSKLESLDPEINQEDIPTRERVSDACIGTPSNLVSAEIASADRAENAADLITEEGKAVNVIDKEVKESVVASHDISETTTEVKSMEIEPEDDALTEKRASAEENLQEDGRWAGSEVHINYAIKDSEITERVAPENENKETKEDKESLQPKKMEFENQEGRNEIQAESEISEVIYTSECNKESSEEKGTSDIGSEKETLEDVKLEKPLNVFDVMEESDFTDRVVPENKNKERPEVERSLQMKEIEDDKQEEGNKTQSVEEVSEAINANKCNKESSEDKEISEKGAEKQKSDDVELKDLLNVVPEKVDIAYGTENINSDGEEKVVSDILEESFQKKEDNTLENTIVELDPVNHCNEPVHDSDATESIIPQEKILKVANFGATKEDQIKMVDDSSINNDLVEEIKDVEPSGSQLQKESVEPKAFDKTEEKFQCIGLEEEEPEKNEKLAMGSENDTNEVMQLEEPSIMVFDRLPTAGLNEKTEKMITAEKDVQAPDVAHERDGPSHEHIPGEENEAKEKKPEIKREPEETDTIVNDIPNDQDLVKLGLSETETNEVMHLEEPTIMVFDRITTAELNEKTEKMIIAEEDVQAPDIAHVRDGPSHEHIQGDEDEAKEKKSETKSKPEETDTILNEILNDKAKESGFMPSEQDLVKTELSENDAKEVMQPEEPSIIMFDRLPTAGLNEKTEKMIAAEEDAQAPDVAHVRDGPSHEQIQGDENEATEEKLEIKEDVQAPEEIDTLVNGIPDDKIKESDFMPSEQDLVKLGLSENETNEVMHLEEPSIMMADTLPTAELNEKTKKMIIAEEIQPPVVAHIRDGSSHEYIQGDEDEAKEKKSETKREPEETDTVLNEILNDKAKESGFMPSEQNLVKTELSEKDAKEVMQTEEPSIIMFDRLPTAGLNEKTEKMIAAEEDAQAPDVAHVRDGPSHEQIQGDENEAKEKKLEIKEIDTLVNDILDDKIKESDFMPSEQDLVKLGLSENETNEVMHLEEPSIMTADTLPTAELNEKTEKMIIAEEVQAPDVTNIRDGPSHEHIQGDEDEAKEKKSETKREPEETDTMLSEILNDKVKESGFMPSEQDLVKTGSSENDAKEVKQLEEPSIIMFDRLPTARLNEKTEKMTAAEEDAQAPDVAHVGDGPSHGQIQGDENEAKEKKPEIKREPEETDTIVIDIPNDKIKESNFMPLEQDLVKLGLSETETNEVTHLEEPSIMVFDRLTTAELNEKTNKMIIAEEDVQAPDVAHIRDGPSHEQIQGDEDEAKEKSETKREPEDTDTILNEILNDKAKESGFMPSEQNLVKTELSENDAKEVMQPEEPSIIMFDRLPTAGLNEKTEKMIAAEEDAQAPDVAHVRDGPSHEQIQEDENEAMEEKPEIKKEPEETDTLVNDIPDDKIKESDFMPSERDLVKLGLCEKTETTLPVDKESAPKESTQIDTKTKIMGAELTDNLMFDAEGQTATEKIEHISTNSVSVDRTFDANSMAFDANEKGEEAMDQEDREKLEEASNLESNKKVDESNDSSTAFTEDEENSQNPPIKKATEVSSPAEEKEIEWQAEGAVHEVIDFDNSENEEKQQTDQDDLPVSRFLMDRILQEEGDELAEACDVKHEDKLQEDIRDDQYNVNISKQETNSASLSAEQVKDNTSISEGKAGDLIKTKGSFDLGQEQSHELNKNAEIAIVKDDESLESNLHSTSLTLTMGEYVKVEVLHILAEESTNIVSDNSIELALEEGGPESKLDVDELKTPDALISIAAHEKLTRSVIQKDDESLKKNIAIVKAFEDDSLKKEGGKESLEVPQDIAGIDKVSYATFQEQTPSISEPVENANSEIQDKETALNLQGDQQTGKSSQSSCVEDITLGEALETQSGGIKVETRKGNQDGTTEIQMQDVKNNLNEELKVSASHNVQQSELIVAPASETAQAGERFLAQRSPTVSADEKQTKEIADAMEQQRNDEDKDGKEQEDEHKTEESGHDVALAVEAKEADTVSADEKQAKETADAMEIERNDEVKDEKEQEDEHKTEESGHDVAVAVEAKEADAVSADEKQAKEIADAMEKERNDEEKDGKEQEDEHKTEESGHDVALAVEAKEADTVSADKKQAKEIADAMEKERNDEEKDEKEQEDEHKTEESGHDVAVAVEVKEADLKPAHKKSHNILSGVGSKVKHSIAKVKKVITGKSSHSKTVSSR